MKKYLSVGLFLLFAAFYITAAADDGTYPFQENVLIARADNAALQYRVVSETIRVVTAYNVGDPGQNAGDPCISANGENICRALSVGEKRCAANFVPFGTELHIEDYGTFVVTDRTNSRYRNRVDIAMKLHEYKKARQFGKRKLNVKILKKVQRTAIQ
jgi:3D (Asp-Asp-Asp) domain-containing protein